MSYAVMPMSDWKSIVDSVKAKTGKSDALKSGDLPSEINSISGGYGDIPSYHFAECNRVAQKINAFKAAHPNNLVFGAVSDIHISSSASNSEWTRKSVKHANFALEVVGAMTECDFIVNLGDNCEETHIDPTITSSPSGLENAKFSINSLKPSFERIAHYALVGNHDKTNDTQTQFNLIGSQNQFDAVGYTEIRGFGYKDYTSKKVRVIVLNTCDYLNASGGCAMSYDQKDFLMRALDLSAKSDASEWQILLLSHIPLDWNGGDYGFPEDVRNILWGYEDGSDMYIEIKSAHELNEDASNYSTYKKTTTNKEVLEYNYSGKNLAKIIANIHGHIHNNKVGKLAGTDFARVATANTSPYGNKSESYAEYGDYSITSSEASKITKVSGTAKDTSATFYCVDLDEQCIYAYGYGADIDRTVYYKSATKYAITYSLSNVTSSNSTASVVEGAVYTTTLSENTGCVLETVKITMGGVDITSTAYNSTTGTITIGKVTGNIVITAVASEILVTETITPHIAPRSTWYGQLSGGKLTLGNSITEGALGVSAANDYAFTDRNSKTFYLMPIGSKYSKATLNYSATDGLAVRYYLQAIKDNGGTFTSVATVGKGTNNVITWAKGSADYLLISIEHSDGSTKWDWNSAGKTITVTFSNQ